MISATCHCGAIRLEVPNPPSEVTECNCSMCRRAGVLWAYYPASSVQVHAASGATQTYAWGPKNIRFVRCTTCGVLTHWEHIVSLDGQKMGVNARTLELVHLQAASVKSVDGASDPL